MVNWDEGRKWGGAKCCWGENNEEEGRRRVTVLREREGWDEGLRKEDC